MSKTYKTILTIVLALLIVVLTYLTVQLQGIKRAYAETEYNHQMIKSQIRCADKAFEILARITKEGCVVAREDLEELESLNCKPSSI